MTHPQCVTSLRLPALRGLPSGSSEIDNLDEYLDRFAPNVTSSLFVNDISLLPFRESRLRRFGTASVRPDAAEPFAAEPSAASGYSAGRPVAGRWKSLSTCAAHERTGCPQPPSSKCRILRGRCGNSGPNCRSIQRSWSATATRVGRQACNMLARLARTAHGPRGCLPWNREPGALRWPTR